MGNKMKICLASDLHLEFNAEPQLAPADVLVLAGDIDVGRSNVVRYLKKVAKDYPHVIYVPGNHEYYAGLDIRAFNITHKFEDKLPDNVHFLNPGDVVIQDVTFTGATLWTNFNNNPQSELMAKVFITDFRRMRNVTPDVMRGEFEYAKMYLEMSAKRPGKKVFVTHFLPAQACVHTKWQGSPLNDYFANHLDDWIAELEDVTWFFGHTHDKIGVQLGSTKLYSNPVGYPGEHNNYQPMIIEV